MKKVILTSILISLFAITVSAQNFYLAGNGITIKCENAQVGDTGEVNGVTYTKRTRDQITVENAATTCASGITDMSSLFSEMQTFNQDISHWDVSSVVTMERMFSGANAFNQDIASWDVSSVTNTYAMFAGHIYNPNSFNQDIGNWDVSAVTDMGWMFLNAGAFN
ncbi:MAG: BspA family leucine-rich repeat surface protein, partial [Balneolaceae bacterium]